MSEEILVDANPFETDAVAGCDISRAGPARPSADPAWAFVPTRPLHQPRVVLRLEDRERGRPAARTPGGVPGRVPTAGRRTLERDLGQPIRLPVGPGHAPVPLVAR